MEAKRLIIQSLPEALRRMNVGETCVSPDNCSPAYVKKACSILKKDGYLFSTSTRSGTMAITRLK